MKLWHCYRFYEKLFPPSFKFCFSLIPKSSSPFSPKTKMCVPSGLFCFWAAGSGPGSRSLCGVSPGPGPGLGPGLAALLVRSEERRHQLNGFREREARLALLHLPRSSLSLSHSHVSPSFLPPSILPLSFLCLLSPLSLSSLSSLSPSFSITLLSLLSLSPPSLSHLS